MTGEQLPTPSSPRDGENISITLGRPKVLCYISSFLGDSTWVTLMLDKFLCRFILKISSISCWAELDIFILLTFTLFFLFYFYNDIMIFFLIVYHRPFDLLFSIYLFIFWTSVPPFTIIIWFLFGFGLQETGPKLGTLMGVFVPCLQNILGIIYYIRFTW